MPLEVVRAKSVRSAAAILAERADARFLGGGTLVVRQAMEGDVSIGALVLSDGLKLDRIRVRAGRVTLGAAVTMAAVAAHPKLAFLRPVALEIGGPAVRAMATVGGNLFAPSPYGDFTVALLALGASVTLEGEGDGEVQDLEAFLPARGSAARRIVREVSFDLPPRKGFRFVKAMRRRPHGASVLSIAAVLPVEAGIVKGARIAYGAMAPTPVRAHAAERALEGRRLDPEAIRAAVAVAAEGTAPASDPFASGWYRANVLPVHLGRLLGAKP